jgi:hypothetical protein
VLGMAEPQITGTTPELEAGEGSSSPTGLFRCECQIAFPASGYDAEGFLKDALWPVISKHLDSLTLPVACQDELIVCPEVHTEARRGQRQTSSTAPYIA